MTLRHFQIYKAVAETQNFTKAAEKLYITQSAVSHAVREMEEEAGTLLFERLPKSVQLTSCGKSLLEEIEPILAAVQNLEKHISRLEQETPIHMVSSITIASVWLPEILKKFEMRYPKLPVEVEVMRAAGCVEALRNGKADLALIEGAKPQGPFTCLPFAVYDLKVLCAPQYPAVQKKLSIQDLCEEKLLLREKGSAVREVFDSTLFLHGYELWPLWTSVSSHALKEAAKAGLGITVLPDLLIQKDVRRGELVELEVEGLCLKNESMILLQKNKNISSSLRELMEWIMQECK
ncbi:MAG: LysR family transcriptional regulator [bacterium]|nr:LysR family transcriptional regulator [bacterium]